MTQYPKINSVFKRDPKTHLFIENEYSCPEFAFLENNEWVWTEKVDGMNVRVIYNGDQGYLDFRGKTDKAQMPKLLMQHLEFTFTHSCMGEVFGAESACLYGEGYGAGIQSGGDYRSDQGFILFDILVGRWWLQREGLEAIAKALGIPIVPIVGMFSLKEAVEHVKHGFPPSQLRPGLGEGIVGQPFIPLKTRSGDRIIAKIRNKDFERES